MHDLAISVAGSMITTLDDDKEINIAEKTRHVSIVGDNINTSSITASLSKASRLRTIISPSIGYSVQRIFGESDCEAIFSSCKFLRILELHGRDLDFLPSSIGKLKHLRYLDLSRNDKLKKLPNSITRLQNLQTLILSGCWD
jgi:Leucine-rich repeat (LRR) protein